MAGDAERWTLKLTPLAAGLGTQLREVSISGRRHEVYQVEMDLSGGDRSVMTIEPMRGPGQ